MKKRLIDNLKYDTYTRIASSKIHGVGVFAIKDIPKDVNIFNICFPLPTKIIQLSNNDLRGVPRGVKIMLNDFLEKRNGKYQIPSYGLNNLNISFYLNHSDKPNIDIKENDREELVCFISNRKIQKGEELFISYDD